MIAVDADAVSDAVRRSSGVARLEGRGLVQVATFLPGRRVEGVQLSDDRVLLSLVTVHGIPLIAVTGQVRSAVAPLVGGRRIDIVVADVQLPGEEQPALPPGAPHGERPGP